MSKATGAMPGESATQTQHSYPFGSGWAAYRLPFPGTSGLSPRDVGIVFEGEPDGGATPPSGGTEPPKPPAAPPAPPAQPDPPKPPATGDDDGLGEAGKRALQAERTARAAAEKELADLKAAGQTDHEKAISEAVKAAKAEERAISDRRVRRSLVEGGLRAKGFANEKALDLAVNAPEFAALKVEEDGSVVELSKVIDQFVKDYPELFTAKAGGDVNRGPNGGSPDRPTSLDGAVAAHYQAGRH